MQALINYFYIDSIRADGMYVRWARLGMFGHMDLIVALCWFMEVMVATTLYTRHYRAAAVAFWMAYLTINLMV